MNIVLTGFMGTGKSVIGKKLAQVLGRTFYDTDEMIEREIGMRITEIFSRKGEFFFRNAEAEAIKLVSALDNLVIAVGGGAVLREENIQELRKNGLIVCLTADLDAIWERVRQGRQRPLLNKKNPQAALKKLFSERASFYQRCDFSVDTTKLSAEKVVEEIQKLIAKSDFVERNR